MDVLAEFRAGTAVLTNGAVIPDSRKGILRVVSMDSLIHLQWLVRERREVIEPPEIDIVIFPEEANFIQVELQKDHISPILMDHTQSMAGHPFCLTHFVGGNLTLQVTSFSCGGHLTY
jgi:hypothetical protein